MKSIVTTVFSMFVAALLMSAGSVAAKAPECDPGKRPESAAQAALIADVPLQMTPVPLNAAQVTDRRIARKIVVQSVHARRTQTDTVEVAARFMNCSRKPLNLLVRTHFMNESQYPSEPETLWRRVAVQPGSLQAYVEKSVGRDVQYFLVEYRGADS